MLFLDCGNTALKCLHSKSTDNEINSFIIKEPLFEHSLKRYLNDISSDTKVIISNVASAEVLTLITTILNGHFNNPPNFAHSEDRYNALKNGYTITQQLGVDRWLALIATQTKINAPNKPRIVIDAGSWIKMDMVLANGQHLGGAIISHSKEQEMDIFKRFSLNYEQCAANVPLFGSSTLECLCASKEGYHLDAVHTLLSSWLTHLNSECLLIISGGDAPLIIKSIKSLEPPIQKNIIDIQHKENLVLFGLSIRYSD